MLKSQYERLQRACRVASALDLREKEFKRDFDDARKKMLELEQQVQSGTARCQELEKQIAAERNKNQKLRNMIYELTQHRKADTQENLKLKSVKMPPTSAAERLPQNMNNSTSSHADVNQGASTSGTAPPQPSPKNNNKIHKPVVDLLDSSDSDYEPPKRSSRKRRCDVDENSDSDAPRRPSARRRKSLDVSPDASPEPSPRKRKKAQHEHSSSPARRPSNRELACSSTSNSPRKSSSQRLGPVIPAPLSQPDKIREKIGVVEEYAGGGDDQVLREGDTLIYLRTKCVGCEEVSDFSVCR